MSGRKSYSSSGAGNSHSTTTTEAKKNVQKVNRFVESDIREGDLIFVKLDGCPYWPAKVISPHSPKIPKSMREEILDGMEDEDGTSSLIEFFGDDKSKYYWMDRVVEIYTRNSSVITNEMMKRNKKLAEAMRQANSYSEKNSTEDKQTIQQRRTSFSDKNLTISTPPSKKRKAVEIDSKKKSKVVDSESEDDNEDEELSDEDDNVSDCSSDGEKRTNDNLEEEEYSFSEEEEEKPKPVKRKIKRTKVEEVDKNTCHKCRKYYKVTVQCTNDECGKVLCKKCCGNPRLDKRYFEDWLCSDCKVCATCEKKTCPITQGNETSRSLYTCTKCDSSYHVNCLAGEGTYVLCNGSLICPECTEKKLEWLERRGENDPEVHDCLFEIEKKDYVMKKVEPTDMEDDEEQEEDEESQEKNEEKSEKVVISNESVKKEVVDDEENDESHTLTLKISNESNDMEKALQCFEKKEEDDSPKKKSPKSGKASKQKPCPLGQFTENIETPQPPSPPKQSPQKQSVCTKPECQLVACSPKEIKLSSPSSESPLDSKRLPASGKSRKATKVRHRVSESSESSGNLGAASSPKEADSFNTSPTSTSPPTTPLSSQLSENEIILFIKCALDGSTDYTKRVRVSNQIDVSQLKNITKSIVLKMKKSTMLDTHKLFLKNVDRFGHEVLLNLDDEFFQNDKLQNNDVLVMQF